MISLRVRVVRRSAGDRFHVLIAHPSRTGSRLNRYLRRPGPAPSTGAMETLEDFSSVCE